MTCERYWREGILLVEQDRPDPHREACLDCRREHEARHELVRAFALIGADHRADARWQARVWSRIARDRAPRARRLAWFGAASATAAACMAIALWVTRTPATRLVASEREPTVELVRGAIAMRSEAAGLDDAIGVTANAAYEIRIYREHRLVLRCGSWTAPHATACTIRGTQRYARFRFEKIGEYEIIVLAAPPLLPRPLGSNDDDITELERDQRWSWRYVVR